MSSERYILVRDHEERRLAETTEALTAAYGKHVDDASLWFLGVNEKHAKAQRDEIVNGVRKAVEEGKSVLIVADSALVERRVAHDILDIRGDINVIITADTGTKALASLLKISSLKAELATDRAKDEGQGTVDPKNEKILVGSVHPEPKPKDGELTALPKEPGVAYSMRDYLASLPEGHPLRAEEPVPEGIA